MREEVLTIPCADGYPLAARLFGNGEARAAVVIAPALGVPARFYSRFAQHLATAGFTTLAFDYRGSGDSARGPVRGRDIRMEDWGRLDIEAVLSQMRERKPYKLFLVGHSAGGQLPGLAAASEQLDGMVFVAASAPHLRHYPLRFWPTLGLTAYAFGPLLSIGRDNFPAKQAGLGTTSVAAGVVAQWSRWVRSRNYLFDAKHGIDTLRYTKLKTPVLSYCFADDSYATPAAVEALLKHYPSAVVDRRVIPRNAEGLIGHFGYFREQHRDSLWRDTLAWLEGQLPAG